MGQPNLHLGVENGMIQIKPLCYRINPGPVFTKGLRLKVETFLSSFCPKTAKTFVLGLVVFTKNLRPILGLAKSSTLRLVGSGLKFCKEDLNMAAVNFSPL